MNIHEYQAKALFEQFGIPCPKGVPVQDLASLPGAIDQITTDLIVVKSQIHAGGRGKGTFTDGFQGGVKLAKSRNEAIGYGEKMLGNTLVTKQTGPAGRKVQTLYINEGSAIKKEYYLAILLDRATSRPVIVASTEGGVEIEEVAEKTPDKITKVFVDPAYGLADFQLREIIFKLGFNKQESKNAAKLIRNLYRMFWETDASMVEVNPKLAQAFGRSAGRPDARDPRIKFREWRD